MTQRPNPEVETLLNSIERNNMLQKMGESLFIKISRSQDGTRFLVNQIFTTALFASLQKAGQNAEVESRSLDFAVGNERVVCDVIFVRDYFGPITLDVQGS